MADTALNAFLDAEALGSPIDAAELGGPANEVDQLGPGMEGDGAAPNPDAYPRDLSEQHTRLVDWFEEAERATQDAREMSERDRDYKDGYQLDSDTLKALKARGQPPLVDNFIRDKVELLCGMERKSRTDPKAFPRTPSEEERADAATQALRYIADDTNFPLIRSDVYENMLVEGFGGAELGIEDDGRGGVNITITQVGWERLWFDPHSRARDFSDARYKGMVLWMDRDQLLEMFPDAEDIASESFTERGGTYSDRPGDVNWQDSKRQRCRVVQAYWKEAGDWWCGIFSRAGFLADPSKSPFLDRKGRSACPLILQAAYIDRENRRYGVVRDLISGQDAINKRQSKALHLLSVNQVIAEQGAVEDVEKARREMARPDGYVEVTPGMRFDPQNGRELASGQFQLLQIAMQRMQAKGPNAAMSGTDPRDQSGRAILAQQAGGAAANEPLADALRQWSRRVYEMAWMAARKFWNEERFLRVTDDQGTTRWVGLNRKITLGEELGKMPEDQRAMTMQQMQIQPNDPRLQQVVRTENEIGDLDVDIAIEEGLDVPAIQAEEFQALIQLAGSQPGLIPPEVLIAASNLRNKQDLLKQMKEASEAKAKQAQVMAPLTHADAVAEVRVKESQALLNESKAMESQHGAVHKVASTHKMAAESPQLPVGEMQPMQPPAPPGGMPPQ